MFGFVFGTLCLFGLVGLVKSSRYHHGGGCGGGRGWGHHRGGWRDRRQGGGFDRPGFGRAAGEIFKRKLGIDEDQEGIVDHALADAFASVKELGKTLKEGRADLGGAFEGDAVDDAALAALFARQDEAISSARRELISAFKQIHAVLEPEQRARAASWLASAESRWV
jgi:hypothetical protein